MENVIFLNENGTHDFLDFIEYGKNLIRFDSFNSEVRLKRCVDIINELLGSESIRIALEEENEEEGNVYAVIWAVKDNPPPSITEDEIDLPERAVQASLEKSSVQLDINSKLKNYAKKIAENNGIRLTSSGGVMFFNGTDKKPPVFSLIQQAYNEGKSFIEFDSKQVKAQTVRIYASQFNTFMGTKFSVSANKDKIRVQFVKPTAAEQAIELFKQSVLALISAGVLDEETARDFVGFVENNDGSKYLAKQPEFIQNEGRTNRIEPEDVTSVNDKNQVFIVDPNRSQDQEDDDEDF